MIIDIHTHIYSKEALLQYRQEGGDEVDKIITIPYFESTNNEIGLLNLDVTREFVRTVEGVYMLGVIDMSSDIGPQLALHREMFTQGSIVGIKLYPGYQRFYPNDERVGPVAQLCAEFKRPLVFHSGLTHSAIRGTVLKYAHPEHLDEVASSYPDTNIVISHFGFPYFLETAAVLSNNPNIYADLSGHIYDTHASTDDQVTTQDLMRRAQEGYRHFRDSEEWKRWKGQINKRP